MNKDIASREEYSRHLKEEQRELGFSNKELADAAGVCLVTAGKYLSGDSYPSEEKRNKITAFIESLYVTGNFHRLERQEFAELLIELIDTLKITQSDISEALKIPQPYISDYANGNTERRIDTRTQYDILNFCLYRMHLGSERFLPEYKKIGERLNNILGTNIKSVEIIDEICASSVESSDPEFKDMIISQYLNTKSYNEETIDYFCTLPVEIKQVIKENENAFFFMEYWEDTNGYYNSRSFVSRFNELEPYEREEILNYLEKFIIGTLRPGSQHVDMMTSFMRLISYADKMPQLLDRKERKNSKSKEFDDWFSSKIRGGFLQDSFTITNLEFKLRMSSLDWYFIMRLYNYERCGKSLTEFDNFLNSSYYQKIE